MDGEAQIRVDIDGVATTSAYPEKFTTCPMGLLRADLRPDAVAVATIALHAAAADMDKRYPDVPARIFALVREVRIAEGEKMRAEFKARDEGRKNHGS